MSNTQSDDESHKESKFGIPGWMVHNIGRLNISTDFEQYAQSPPENEGFLADPLDSPNGVFPSRIIDEESDISKNVLNTEKISEKYEIKHLELNVPEPKYDSLHKSLLEVLKCDETLYSSPDSTPYSTPYSTPQPSPAPQRKNSSQETVQSNPEKWFYLGGKDKNKMKLLKGKEHSLLHYATDLKFKKTDEKRVKAKIPVQESHVKLAISNFDLNAISPSSW